MSSSLHRGQGNRRISFAPSKLEGSGCRIVASNFIDQFVADDAAMKLSGWGVDATTRN
jgi:hypothetical protein